MSFRHRGQMLFKHQLDIKCLLGLAFRETSKTICASSQQHFMLEIDENEEQITKTSRKCHKTTDQQRKKDAT